MREPIFLPSEDLRADPLAVDEPDLGIVEMADEVGDEARVVLAVAVERDDDRRPRRDDSRS